MNVNDLMLRGSKRKIDNAGRLNLPVDLKRDLGIHPGSIVELFVVGDNEGVFVRLSDDSKGKND